MEQPFRSIVLMIIHRIVNFVFNSCTYVVHGEESRQAMIVDCGDVEPITDYLTEHRLVLSHILLTHSHFDHIYGLNAIIQQFSSVKIITNKFGLEGLRSPKLNISHYHTDCEDFVFSGLDESVQICFDSEILSICGLEVKILATPGHDSSCLSYITGDNLFTGDSYIPGIKVVANWPKSDKKLAKESEEGLRKMKQQYLIRAGHKNK